jgi:hypothetical protein
MMTSASVLKDRYRNRVAARPQLTFPEILDDPLVRTVMRADGVQPKALEAELGRVAAYLRKLAPAQAAEPCAACL